MNNIWKEFDEKIDYILHKLNGKTTVILGYGRSGWFIEHLLKTNGKNVEYVIDDRDAVPKLQIERSIVFNELPVGSYYVLVSYYRDADTENMLNGIGLRENIDYLFVKDYFFSNDLPNSDRQLSYYDWLEYKYNVDIVKKAFIGTGENHNYSPGIDYAVMTVINAFKFNENDAVFDFGCGKCGALILFNKCGVREIAGVEYDENLYNIGVTNLAKCGLETSNVVRDNAINITTELDDYNYFFMYNPFGGETFDRVIRNIEESFKRVPRKIVLIYSGPHFHKTVIKNKMFILSKKVYTDYAVRNVYIYTLEDRTNPNLKNTIPQHQAIFPLNPS